MSEKRLGTLIMSIKFKLCVALLMLFVSGCMGTLTQPVTVPDDDCVETVPASPTAKSDFVNYTETAADYRRYGERTPRDQNIVQAGAGSNMSASIPPSVDEEVEEYDENVVAEESGDGNNANAQNAEDPVEDWLAEEGQNLKDLLGEWSDRASWRLVWKTNRNYPLTAGAMFRGRFADASAALIRTFARAKPAPVATFYKGNRVLVVETMEDENAFE